MPNPNVGRDGVYPKRSLQSGLARLRDRPHYLTLPTDYDGSRHRRHGFPSRSEECMMCNAPESWGGGQGEIPLSGKLQNSTRIRRTAKIAAAALLLLPAAPVYADDLPEGAGKELVAKVCTACHDTVHFTSKRRTQEEWNKTVDTMAQRGAQASDEEFDTIVAYLAKNFGKDKPPDKAPDKSKDEPAK